MDEVVRVWTNSWFGRTLSVVFAAAILGIVAFVEPDTGPRWTVYQVLISVVFVALITALVVAIFTSRLTIEDGVLTATNFFRSRSMNLVDVDRVKPGSFLISGLLIRSTNGETLRTLVTGEVGNELWRTRAHKVAVEIEDLAEAARQASAPQPS